MAVFYLRRAAFCHPRAVARAGTGERVGTSAPRSAEGASHAAHLSSRSVNRLIQTAIPMGWQFFICGAQLFVIPERLPVQARASEWGHPRHEVPKALRTPRSSVLQALISLFKLPFRWSGSFLFAAHGLIYRYIYRGCRQSPYRQVTRCTSEKPLKHLTKWVFWCII